MSSLRGWLREPDQFDWVTAYLRQRSLLRSSRLFLAFLSASSAVVVVSALSSTGASSTVSIAAGVGGTLLAATMLWFWLTRWPTRRQSLYSNLIGAGCASVLTLYQSEPAIGALACMIFSITGGYAAFFHGTRALLVNAVIAIPTGLLTTVRLAQASGVSTAVSALWLILLLNVAIPTGIRGAVTTMRVFAARSVEDPLTGLLNRRGFGEVVGHRMVREVRQDPNGNLVVLMIDLDDFKRVNDTKGHAAGDRILLDVARILRERMPAAAAICRAGGEEFLVALPTPAPAVPALAVALCESIRTDCDDLTASVGIAHADRRAVLVGDPDTLVAGLVGAADAAMYEAKRSGGNRVHLADAVT